VTQPTPTPDGLLTDDQLKAIEERANAATAAPWSRNEPGIPARPYIVCRTSDDGYQKTTVAFGTPTGGQGWPAIGVSGWPIEEIRANADFIAHAREDVPLAREIRRQRVIDKYWLQPRTGRI
jgi:hypothetical protein